uniref:Uncharacterized protein n=1 Tax=Caenorhabditis japonica TaxID=281687 RepID=A0A8R1DV62_CAEJA
MPTMSPKLQGSITGEEAEEKQVVHLRQATAKIITSPHDLRQRTCSNTHRDEDHFARLRVPPHTLPQRDARGIRVGLAVAAAADLDTVFIAASTGTYRNCARKRDLRKARIRCDPGLTPFVLFAVQVSQLSPHPSQMSKTDDDHPPSILSVGRAEIGTFHSAKLENQKARESYYNAQAYGSNPLKKEADIDKFSEQLDNALKIDGATITTTLSPQSKPNVETATTPRDAAVGGVFGRQKFRMQPQDVGFKLLGDSENTEKAMRSEMLTIETRRTVMREGGSHFEEQTIISFPRTLPPNVRVITAQFVPVATQSA